MPSVPILIRGVKEPVDSGRPYLKPSTKEKREQRKSQKARQPKGEKSHAQERRYARRRAVKALRRTWFLVKWVPKIIKIPPKIHFKSKEELLVKTPAK